MQSSWHLSSFRIAIFGLFALVFFFSAISIVKADTLPSGPIGVHGWAWSDNVGWISFNCDQTPVGGANTCGTSNYGVELRDSGSEIAELHGWAWSDNVGWIKFHNLWNFPGSPSYTDPVVHQISVGNYDIRGWARVCSGTTSGDCTNMTDHSADWDGWISLNCRNNSGCAQNYGLTPTFSGGMSRLDSNDYAWGSNVIGWVQFTNVVFDPPYSPQWYRCEHNPPDPTEQGIHHDEWQYDDQFDVCTLPQLCSDVTFRCVTPIDLTDPLTYTFAADPGVVRQYEATELSWNVPQADNCRITSSAGDEWAGLTSNDSLTSNDLEAQTSFTLFCQPTDLTAEQELKTIDVNIVPVSIEI